MPTRVVNVTDPFHPLLEGAYDMLGDYVTLSYKWGNATKSVSSKFNIHAHLSAITRKLLPRTFQDAIDVTHQLGYSIL
jgi:hypothetical protein